MNSVFILKYFFVFCLALLFISCSGIKVEQDVKVSQGDWIMSGGSSLQQNISSYTLAPPLELHWDYNIEGGVGPAGVCIADAVLFVNSLSGELFTFDVSTGGKLGTLKFLGKEAAGAPLIMDNSIIVSYAGDNKYSLASYNVGIGEISWRKNYGYIQTSPILSGNSVYFGSLNGNQYKVNSDSGSIIWRFETKSPIHSTCAVTSEAVVFGNDTGNIYCLSAADGTEKWKIETGAPVNAVPMIDNETVYIGGDDSLFKAINLSDGTIKWKNNLSTKIISGSALNGEQVIVTCVDGSVYSLNITDGSVKWKFTTYGVIASAPVISGGFIYLGSYDSYLYVLDAESGIMKWSIQLENKIKTSPVVWRDFLFVVSDNIVYCFSNKPRKIENNNGN